MTVNDINRRTEINEEEDEDDYEVNVPFEIAGCYGHDWSAIEYHLGLYTEKNQTII